jgi:DNA-binding NtrC family response regulator
VQDDGTERRDARSVPVRSLSAEVVEGPDRGRSASAALDRLTIGTAEGNDLVLTDRTVSRYHLELEAAADGIAVRDLGSTNGTRVGTVLLSAGRVPPGAVLSLGGSRIAVGEGADVPVPLHGSDGLAGIRGSTATMRRLMAQIERVARTDAAVLVQGESGTGKELVARALHDLGPRGGKPFVTVDCGALAPTLVASELFGHEAGAFTGADRRHAGAFERADGGTLFLDEVGELPQTLQPALLGVLERRRFRRVGGREELAVDVRVVSATHRDLRGDVNAGRFRLDLYYRLAVVVLAIPPLRERPDDIPLLVSSFLAECGEEPQASALLSPDALAVLEAHRWPGNVRELRNFVEASVAMGEAPPLAAAEGPAGEDAMAALLERPWKEARGALLHELEGRYLVRLMERARGNVSRASRLARLDRGHLTDLLRRHGLK